MNISKKNFFARYWRWSYGSLPNNFCSLFWGTIVSMALFVFHAPLFWAKPSPLLARAFFGFVVELLVGLFIYHLFTDTETTLITIGVVTAITGVVIGILYVADNWDKSSFKTALDNVMGRYCTKIKWKK